MNAAELGAKAAQVAIKRCERHLALLREATAPEKIDNIALAFSLSLRSPSLSRKLPNGSTGWGAILAPLDRLVKHPRGRAAAWRAVARAGLLHRPESEAQDWACRAFCAGAALDAGPGSLALMELAAQCLRGDGAHMGGVWALANLARSNPDPLDPDALAHAAPKARLALRLLLEHRNLRSERPLDSIVEPALQSHAFGVAVVLGALGEELASRASLKSLEEREAREWVLIGAEALRSWGDGAFERERAEAASQLLIQAIACGPQPAKDWIAGSFAEQLIGEALSGATHSCSMPFALAALAARQAGLLAGFAFSSGIPSALVSLQDEAALRKQRAAAKNAGPARI